MEWLLINKNNEINTFKDIKEVCEFTHLTKSQVNNMLQQSIKHINRYTNYGYYLQRLYNNSWTHQRKQFVMNKYIYFTNHTQENHNYIVNNFKNNNEYLGINH